MNNDLDKSIVEIENEFDAKEKLEIVLSAPVPAYRSGRQGESRHGGTSPASSVRIFSNRHRRLRLRGARHAARQSFLACKIPTCSVVSSRRCDERV